MRIVDLSFPIKPHFRWKVAFEPEKSETLPREESTTHHAFFPVSITVIEYLTNLDQVGVPRCRFIALPLAVEGADGSPVRAVALVE
jgi:kynurenine formamidase